MKTKLLIFLLFTGFVSFSQIPESFKNVQDEIPSIATEVRYYGKNNFVGVQIDGYKNPKVYLTNETIEALKKVQKELKKQQLGLKLFDGYRPQKAVNHFVRWARVLNDTAMKANYYPKVSKSILFKEGYIAAKSGHTRGSTVDLTIINVETGEELDMGSPYDMFDPISWVASDNISPEQQRNRNLLQKVMLGNGFKNYAQEWWHFTLRNEPFPKTYFDFDIE